MKGNTDTIVYIIIIIASILFSLLKKNKKNQTNQKVADKPDQFDSSNIISTILGDNFDTPPVDESYKKTESLTKNIQPTEKSNTKQTANNKTSDKPHFEEQEPERNFNVLENFDLPQAIVYTEILKRKEF